MGDAFMGSFSFANYKNARYINLSPETIISEYDEEISLDSSNNIYLTHDRQNYTISTNENDIFVLNSNMSGFTRGLFDLIQSDIFNSDLTNYSKINNFHTGFAGCYSLINSPICGIHTKSMYGTYYNCSNITGDPIIHSRVNNMIGTYYNCVKLTGSPQGSSNVNAAIGSYYNCVNLTGAPASRISAKSIQDLYYNCYKLSGNPSNCNNAFITSGAYYNCPNIYGNFYWGFKNASQAYIVNAQNMFYNRNISNKLNIYAYAAGSVLNALVNYSSTYGNIYGSSPLVWTLVADPPGSYYNNAATNTNIYIMLDPPKIVGAEVNGCVVNIHFKIPKNQRYTHIYLAAKKDDIPSTPEDSEVFVEIYSYQKTKEVDLEYDHSDYYFVIFAESEYGKVSSEPYKVTTGQSRFPALLASQVALKHNDDGNEIWYCYIKASDGVIRIQHAPQINALDPSDYEWEKENLHILPTPTGVKCDMAFDSYIRYNGDTAEFITEDKPCIAYISAAGACDLLDLNTGTIQTIAAENVIDVSIVRSPIIGEGQTDYGFTVFFIAGDKVYYRQRIDGIWYDAEVISVADNNKTYVALEAFCTWDYRTGVQITDEDGNLYQFITYPEGILNQEHHIEFNGISASSTLIWGWSAIPVLVENIEDGGNWGTTIRVTFDWPNTESGLSPTMFTLVDDNGINYVCQSCSLNGTYLTLTFDDFNLAGRADNVTLTYTKPASGGLISPAVQTDSFSEIFVPVNLDPPQIDPPTFLSASNSDVMTIDLVLTEMMLNTDVSDMLSHFTITWQEYDWTPGGALHTETRTLATLTKINDTTLRMVINKPSFTSVIGDITISYDGQGGLRGLGGPASAFEDSFTPTGLTWKGHQNDEEHIEFTGVTANIDLHAIVYTDVKSADEHIEFDGINANINLHAIVYTDTKTTDEHIEFNGISANVTLTDIHDI